jgi:hypothetical protein
MSTFCAGPLMPDTSPTPVDPGDALSELYWLTDCHCDPAWTDRQLHAPDCNAYLRESVDVVALSFVLLVPP